MGNLRLFFVLFIINLQPIIYIMTAWTNFATEYHKNSGGKSFKATLKAAGKLWRAKGMNKSKGRKRGGDATTEEAAAAAATKAAADAATKAEAEAKAAATKAAADAAAAAEAEAATKAAEAATKAATKAAADVPPAMGGKSKRRKGSKKRKTRRR